MSHDEADAGGSGPLEEFARSVELGSIFFESFSAKLERLAQPHSMELQVGASYATPSDSVFYRFIVNCVLRDAASEGVTDDAPATGSDGGDPSYKRAALAYIDLVLVCQCRRTEDSELPSEEVLEKFGDEVVMHAVYPYMREAIASMVVRLGFPALTIGLPFLGGPLPPSVYGRFT